MNDPRNPLNMTTWTRATQLGVILVGLFSIGAVIIYILAGVIGWEGAARGLMAIFVGPVLGVILFFVGWSIWQPQWETPVPPPPQPRDTSAIDQTQRSEARTIIDPAE